MQRGEAGWLGQDNVSGVAKCGHVWGSDIHEYTMEIED